MAVVMSGAESSRRTDEPDCESFDHAEHPGRILLGGIWPSTEIATTVAPCPACRDP
jgi:hypothetical protein